MYLCMYVERGKERAQIVLPTGEAVPWQLTLAALKHYVFKNKDVRLEFRRLVPGEEPPRLLTIDPPPEE